MTTPIRSFSLSSSLVPPLSPSSSSSSFSSQAAQGTIDARDSTIAKLQHQLRTEQNKLKSYEERTPALEAKVTMLEEGIKRTQQSLDEKTSALSTTRKHLKHARERNMVRWASALHCSEVDDAQAMVWLGLCMCTFGRDVDTPASPVIICGELHVLWICYIL